MADDRRWILKGGADETGRAYLLADGPVPDVNEQVSVVPQSEFDRVSQDLRILKIQVYGMKNLIEYLSKEVAGAGIRAEVLAKSLAALNLSGVEADIAAMAVQKAE